MVKITQTMHSEGLNNSQLRDDLREWHREHPLHDNGIDWEFQYMWATMTNEDCLAFCLKHPQYSNRFKAV
jgi:hypothetical protein